MQRSPVASSSIATLGYDAAHAVLEVEFHSGAVYRYVGVPRSVYEMVLRAGSIGRAFNQLVRGRYPTVPY